jgi:alginate O-acetyltransferase complex protein AlgI
MQFNSITFLIFLAGVYLFYRVLPHRGQNILILVASYVFYGWWDIRFLSLIVISTALDFSCGLLIHEGSMTKRQRTRVSIWVVVFTFFFVVVQWNKIILLLDKSKFSWSELVSWKTGWLIFIGICLFTLFAHLMYRKISSLEASKKRKIFLIVSICGNLAILGFFKYFNFFIDNLGIIIRSLGLNPISFHLNIMLPIGISFYTFQTMNYTIDIYRGKLIPTSNFYDYALYVAFFPKLLAGPIERAVNLLPQITEKRNITIYKTSRGLHLILYGLFKKVVIADGVVETVNQVFGATYQISWIDAIVGTFLFAVQIYCDFSGYSDIAIGTANLFGFEFMRNFHFPYFARNPSEFWGRWHISLSSWFRDYVFFPLGGPYGRTIRWIRNILLTFFVTGLWHGAAWNYVIWGLYHGILLCLHRIKESFRTKKKRSKPPLTRAASAFPFFILTCLGWIIFRSHSIEQIKSIFSTLLFGIGNFKLNAPLPTPAALLAFPVFVIMEFIGYASNGKRIDEVLPIPIWTAAYAAMIFTLIMGLSYVSSEFIYFVF